MSTRPGFTLRDMFVGVAIFGFLLMLLMPAFHAARESSRRNTCIGNNKQLLLSLHNYHAVYHRFPNSTSTAIRGIAPASLSTETSPGAGYHWLVSILPWLEEQKLFDGLAQGSRGFSRSPFAPEMVGTTAESARQFSMFQCPSRRSQRDFAAAPEFVAVGKSAVASVDYVALSATHLDCILGDPDSPEYLAANGVMIPGPTVIDLRSITDGSSRTLILVETHERNYTSWYDGTVGWVVGADPNSDMPRIGSIGHIEGTRNSATALNIGPAPDLPSRFYLPAAICTDLAVDWQWGPSSEHAGDIIVHGVADGSVRTLTSDIDTTLYLQLITRTGREPMSSCCDDDD